VLEIRDVHRNLRRPLHPLLHHDLCLGRMGAGAGGEAPSTTTRYDSHATSCVSCKYSIGNGSDSKIENT
jgi:hypothetical protein